MDFRDGRRIKKRLARIDDGKAKEMFQGHSLVHGPGSLVHPSPFTPLISLLSPKPALYERDTIFGFPAIQVKFHAVHLCYGR